MSALIAQSTSMVFYNAVVIVVGRVSEWCSCNIPLTACFNMSFLIFLSGVFVTLFWVRVLGGEKIEPLAQMAPANPIQMVNDGNANVNQAMHAAANVDDIFHQLGMHGIVTSRVLAGDQRFHLVDECAGARAITVGKLRLHPRVWCRDRVKGRFRQRYLAGELPVWPGDGAADFLRPLDFWGRTMPAPP